FLLLSHLAASDLDALAGYRSIFLLPDSFIAMSARDETAGIFERVSRGLLFGLAALLLSLVLAWRVIQDGMRVGLSKDTRAAWAGGTLLFGLPAYLTYRLTRPHVTLVTCHNCGQRRRPDRDTCHRCGSPWDVPELTPPAWRVLGAPEGADDGSSTPAPQQAIEPAEER
ncbi:MAG: hypothetical protein MUC88_16865, partial [Planctomycetes bacterium]|nr:hypothetical protein [Planctomycetota bacterium]